MIVTPPQLRKLGTLYDDNAEVFHVEPSSVGMGCIVVTKWKDGIAYQALIDTKGQSNGWRGQTV